MSVVVPVLEELRIPGDSRATDQRHDRPNEPFERRWHPERPTGTTAKPDSAAIPKASDSVGAPCSIADRAVARGNVWPTANVTAIGHVLQGTRFVLSAPLQVVPEESVLSRRKASTDDAQMIVTPDRGQLLQLHKTVVLFEPQTLRFSCPSLLCDVLGSEPPAILADKPVSVVPG